ncbi:MAG: alpha/beta hydrolase [Sphingomonadales bacterium]|nr:alpha/beta hydrolase [Sphingomonadales bacterium]
MLYSKSFIHRENTEWVVFVHGAGGSSSIWHKQLKDFCEKHNVLLLDLRGHGKSQKTTSESKYYSFDLIAKDVIDLLDQKDIGKAHFVGVSLGSIVIKVLRAQRPDLVKSMIFAGAVTKLNIRSRLILRAGRILYSILPQMSLYKLMARIMMPRANHKASRDLFINEAKKVVDKEFQRWFKLTERLTAYLTRINAAPETIPTLYVMGEQDHMFLNPVRILVDQDHASELQVVPSCGHVVNFEQAETFNSLALQFISRHCA